MEKDVLPRLHEFNKELLRISEIRKELMVINSADAEDLEKSAGELQIYDKEEINKLDEAGEWWIAISKCANTESLINHLNLFKIPLNLPSTLLHRLGHVYLNLREQFRINKSIREKPIKSIKGYEYAGREIVKNGALWAEDIRIKVEVRQIFRAVESKGINDNTEIPMPQYDFTNVIRSAVTENSSLKEEINIKDCYRKTSRDNGLNKEHSTKFGKSALEKIEFYLWVLVGGPGGLWDFTESCPGFKPPVSMKH
ncbi:MAG: hypothetical protein ACQXXG_09715 [Candidatus Bathyarchaeia archaeon]